MIGQGSFGVVLLGTYRGTKVGKHLHIISPFRRLSLCIVECFDSDKNTQNHPFAQRSNEPSNSVLQEASEALQDVPEEDRREFLEDPVVVPGAAATATPIPSVSAP